jgi:hypothetical protein
LPAPGLVEGIPLRQGAANSRHSCQALIRKKSLCQSDAQVAQPDQSSGEEVSNRLSFSSVRRSSWLFISGINSTRP